VKITIIIPSYNTGAFLEECVDSAFAQSYQNIEVILVDNESTDDTPAVIDKLKNKYPTLITDSAPNIYKYSWEEPVDKALSLATGEYFTILGSDDYLESEYIQNYVKILQGNSNKVFLIQSVLRTFDNSNKTRHSFISHQYGNIGDLKQKMLTHSPVATPTMFYNMKLYKQGLIKWNSDKFLGSCDYALYCSLVDLGYYIYSFPGWLGYNYRWHPSQSTWGMKREPTDYDRIIQNHWKEKWKM